MSAKKKQAPAKVVKKPGNAMPKPAPVSAKPVFDIFDKLGKKSVLLALGLLLLIGFLVFKDYLLFDKAYFFKDIGSDSYNASYPYLYSVAGYIAQHGMPQWSFSMGMGQNLFPFFLRDPFDVLLFMAGKDHIIYGMVYIELLKIISGGLIFFYYLKTLKLSDYTAITGSLLFAFCGFVIVGSGWYIFSFEAFNMALLLLAFELLLSKKNWYLFPIAIFLLSLSQPFNLYVYGLFLALYALFRLLQTNTFNIKDGGGLFLKMAGLGILGILLSGPFFLENIIQLIESPRGSGQYSYAHTLSSNPMFAVADRVQLGTSILRFFASDILGSGNDFKGWMNILEAPLFYCGIPCLVIVPQIFQFLDSKLKKVFGVFLALWLLPVIFPYFRQAFWLFSGDYYRAYSFLVALVLLYYALFALDHIIKECKINLTVLIITVIGLLILLNYPYFPDKDIMNPSISVFVNFMIVVYAALLFLMSRQKDISYLKYIFLGAVVVELFFLSGFSVNDRDAVTAAELSQRTGYNDYSVEALDFIREHDKSFYRIDKNYASSPAMHYSLNDALAQGYNGTSSYNPFNQVNYIGYLRTMGAIDTTEIASRWAMGLLSRPVLEAENSVKYLLVKSINNPLWRLVCDSIGTFGNVTVLRNKLALPLGYTYNSYVKSSDFNTLSTGQKDYVSLKACVIKDTDVNKVQGLKEFQLKGSLSAFTIDTFSQNVNELKKDTLVINQRTETFISGKISVSEDKMMYLSIPFDGGWNLKVDGHDAGKIVLDGGMTGVMLKKGTHTVDLAFHLRGYHKGLFMSLLGILLYAGLWFYSKRKIKNVTQK